jgi:hypothetical protein
LCDSSGQLETLRERTAELEIKMMEKQLLRRKLMKQLERLMAGLNVNFFEKFQNVKFSKRPKNFFLRHPLFHHFQHLQEHQALLLLLPQLIIVEHVQQQQLLQEEFL